MREGGRGGAGRFVTSSPPSLFISLFSAFVLLFKEHDGKPSGEVFLSRDERKSVVMKSLIYSYVIF